MKMADNKKTIGAELAEILDDFEKDLRKATDKAVKKVAKETAAKIKDKAPRTKTAGRHYADGWTVKADGYGGYVVYNQYKPQLTHLLEKGHAKVNGGRVEGQEHIKPAEDWAASVIVERVKREVE